MKNHFDAFDQWILTDNQNINNWGMDTYYGFMAASKVGSRRVFLGDWHWSDTLKAERGAAFSAVNSRLDSQSDTLESLEANATSDTVVDLEATVKQLHSKVEQLSEKCLDLEGRSKRQNLRIAGVKEGEEKGQKARDFVAQLLMEVLQLDEKPLIDRAHRALRQRPGDNEPPRHLILRMHYCHALESILHEIPNASNIEGSESKSSETLHPL